MSRALAFETLGLLLGVSDLSDFEDLWLSAFLFFFFQALSFGIRTEGLVARDVFGA